MFWGLAFLAPFAAVFGPGAAFHELVHVLILEYIPFIALIGALFVIAGGIYIGGEIRASPRLNSLIMLAGMVLASFAGTTGAAMILIRPILRANKHRLHKAHIVVFLDFPRVQHRGRADAARETRRCSSATSKAWISSGR